MQPWQSSATAASAVGYWVRKERKCRAPVSVPRLGSNAPAVQVVGTGHEGSCPQSSELIVAKRGSSGFAGRPGLFEPSKHRVEIVV